MTQRKQHDCYIIKGLEAIEAYKLSERNAHTLSELGSVSYFEYGTLSELNAFLRGIDVSYRADVLAVDDLYDNGNQGRQIH